MKYLIFLLIFIMRSFLYTSFQSILYKKLSNTGHNSLRSTYIQNLYKSSSIRLFSTEKDVNIELYNLTVSSIQGRRNYMEDEYVMEEINPFTEFLGVFDGHAGAKVSKYIKDHLYSKFIAIASKNVSIPEQLKQSLKEIDEEVNTRKFYTQGSTACIVVIEKSTDLSKGLGYYHTANAGDSRIVLSRGGKAIDLTIDHKPDSPSERLRIESLKGGKVEWVGDVDKKTGKPILQTGCYRVQGNLALSRSIGDHYLRPYVSSEPDLNSIAIDSSDDFIIAATDGFWDVFSSQRAVEFVEMLHTKALEANNAGEKAKVIEITTNYAAILAAYAYHFGSYDNITVILKWLRSK